METKNKVLSKDNELVDILRTHWGKKVHLSRIKFMAQLLTALCTVQTVCYERLAGSFRGGQQVASTVRRIQRFMSGYGLDSGLMARFMVGVLGMAEHRYHLALDRTGWRYGQREINLLVLSILHQGYAFPVLVISLCGRGNSGCTERALLIDRFRELFGPDSIASLVADREFIGSQWMDYLHRLGIRFYLRIKSGYRVTDSKGNRCAIGRLFLGLKIGQQRRLRSCYYQQGVACYLTGVCFANQNGQTELLILACARDDQDALSVYRKRWQIECAFKSFKSAGFNLEDTHVTDRKRIEKLFLMIAMAYTWSYLVGDFLDKNRKPIRRLKNKRKAVSTIRYGLNYIDRSLRIAEYQKDMDIFNFLSCT